MKAKLIVAEGIDRVGKSTQVDLLIKKINDEGKKAILVKSPYDDGAVYNLIYWMLKNGTARVFPNAFQIFHFINKLYFQVFILPKLLERYDFVILDRWTWSMYAYGVADGASRWLTRKMIDCVREPDHVLLFDGEPHINTKGDSYENDKEYQKVVRKFYYFIAITTTARKPKAIKVINANRNIDVIHDDVMKYFSKIR